MYYKVKIKSLPKAKVGYQVDGSLKNDVTSFGGKNNGLQDHSNIKVTKSITAVPRKDANLEAEGGETIIGNIDGSKIPSFFNIEGPRHSSGGVPLNLPDDSFIFSDTKAMMITDPTLLKLFNMPAKKGGYTPAEMSKKFDINKYREILQNKNSDKLDIKTAEMMIKNYVMKLGALALAQESKKGFPQGIPKLSEPYMEANGITEEELLPQKETQQPNQQSQGQSQKNEPTNMPNGEPIAKPQEEMMQYGGGIRRLRRAQEGGPKDTLIYPPGDSEYMNQPPLNYDILQMLDNKRRLEYNDYMRDQRDPTNINNAPPAYRKRFLAKPKTVQAQEGMQQPSEEEMMMMQQQQAQQQQQPQQSGQDQQMMQIMQQVAEALQQGAEPEELTVELLQGQVPPEAIMQIFAELGMPQEQVQQLVMGVIQQMQGGQEQDPRQQQMSEEEMMAMQQQDPRQMQQAPMAAYGMSMGGYDMPYAENGYSYSNEDKTEMSEDIEPCPPCPDGNVPVRTDSGDCPCSNIKENLKFYNFALKERDSIMNQPAMWNEDPDMMNPDGSYKFCVDCLIKDYNDPDVVKSVSALINDGIANFPKYDYPDLIKGLEKFNLPMPVYQSNIKKSKGGASNSRPLSMAQYGMDMGGYDMPFYDDPYEMAYGGMPKYVTGGPGDTEPKKIKKSEYDSDKYKDYTEKDKVKTKTTYNEISGKKEYTSDRAPSGGGKNPNLVADLCRNMKQPGSRHYGKTAEEVVAYAGLNKSAIVTLKACEQKATVKSVDAVTYDDEGDTPCICLKTDGSTYTDAQGNTKKAPTDPTTGECLPYDKSCNESTPCVPESEEYINKEKECTAAGKKFDGPNCKCVETTEGCTPDTDVYNKAKAICDEKGEEFDPSICNCATTPGERKPPEWWLQDTVNTMGAASDLASVKKYMPWEARVDLEEPRPTFLDPTRELGQQSEQANIAAQASASFAGAQGLGARNAATQGQGAAQAANTLSNINNQNVNIANQFEGTQVGIRNQESMLNQQMANRVFDKNTIANQQFDNAKLAGRQNLRNSYNTGVTNKWKTDALNQMYPNYQTRPGVGGRVIYTPTDKKLDTTKRKDAYDAALAHCEGQGYAKDKGMTACMELYMKYHAAQYGGESFENGGYVYTVYPNY